jgi:hypothetical protein
MVIYMFIFAEYQSLPNKGEIVRAIDMYKERS